MFNEMFWITAAFILLCIGIARPVKRQVIATIDGYTRDVTQNLQVAESMHTEAREMLEMLHKEMDTAYLNAEAIIKRANEDASQIIAEAKQEAERIAQKRGTLALQRISQYEENVLQNIKAEVISMAVASVEQKLGEGLDKSMQLKIMEDDLTTIKKVVH